MKICTKCGNELHDEKFCPKCGTKNESASNSTNEVAVNGTFAETDDTVYSEFKIGAKIWFALCGVLNIILNFVTSISALVLLGKGYLRSSTVLPLITAVMGIALGFSYLMLMKTRKKSLFNSIVSLILCVCVLNFINLVISDATAGSIILSVLFPIANVVISYVILSKYNGNPVLPNFLNNNSAENVAGENATFSGSMCCPKCGSNHLQVVNETKTTGGGYSAGNGCCGYILLGPLGLLCGSCGSKTKTTNKAFFVCMDCGNKFAK